MKKTIILLMILLLFSFFVKTPKYVELNNLIIVDSINVECSDDKYTVYLKEIVPTKDDNGIEYEYKKYKEIGNNLNNIIKSIEKKEKKEVFLEKAKFKSNCIKKKELIQ